jgi:hypothetical protein
MERVKSILAQERSSSARELGAELKDKIEKWPDNGGEEQEERRHK